MYTASRSSLSISCGFTALRVLTLAWSCAIVALMPPACAAVVGSASTPAMTTAASVTASVAAAAVAVAVTSTAASAHLSVLGVLLSSHTFCTRCLGGSAGSPRARFVWPRVSGICRDVPLRSNTNVPLRSNLPPLVLPSVLVASRSACATLAGSKQRTPLHIEFHRHPIARAPPSRRQRCVCRGTVCGRDWALGRPCICGPCVPLVGVW